MSTISTWGGRRGQSGKQQNERGRRQRERGVGGGGRRGGGEAAAAKNPKGEKARNEENLSSHDKHIKRLKNHTEQIKKEMSSKTPGR